MSKAHDKAATSLLQYTISQISDLVRLHQLHAVPRTDPLRSLARAHILQAMRRLPGAHKGLLLRFLYDADLIAGSDGETGQAFAAVINLNNAILADMVLPHVNLTWSHLVATDLSRADLRGAWLMCANLGGTDLIDTDLRGADLTLANLTVSDMRGAQLDGANLSGAKVTAQQIETAHTTDSTILPW